MTTAPEQKIEEVVPSEEEPRPDFLPPAEADTLEFELPPEDDEQPIDLDSLESAIPDSTY